MVCFRLTKTQEQSYYAIRLLAVLHLFVAVGIVILIDGFHDGIGRLAMGLILLLLAAVTWVAYQLYRAIVRKTIYGYCVLTKNTLAIKRPGKPCQFLHRRDCTGFIPYRWELVFRGKNVVSLKAPGRGGYYVRELGKAVVQTWWPEFSQGAIWRSVTDAKPMGPLETRIDFQGGRDQQYPVLICRFRRLTPVALFFHAVIALPVAISYVLTLYGCIQVLPYAQTNTWNVLLVALSTLIFLLPLGGVWGYVLWRFLHERMFGRRYLLSRQGMKILTPGQGCSTLRPAELLDYAPLTGTLRTTKDARIEFALPLSMGIPFTRLIYTALHYWGIERSPLWDKHLQQDGSTGWTESSLLLGTIWMWNSQPFEFSELGTDYGTMTAVHFLFGTIVLVGLVGLVIYFTHAKGTRIPFHAAAVETPDVELSKYQKHTTA